MEALSAGLWSLVPVPGLLGPEGFKLEGQDGIRVGRSGLVAVGRELGWQRGQWAEVTAVLGLMGRGCREHV